MVLMCVVSMNYAYSEGSVYKGLKSEITHSYEYERTYNIEMICLWNECKIYQPFEN